MDTYDYDELDPRPYKLRSTKRDDFQSYSNRFYSSKPEQNESKSWDFDHPSTGMILLAACIPVIGWAYLVYVLFKAINESYGPNDEDNRARLEL